MRSHSHLAAVLAALLSALGCRCQVDPAGPVDAGRDDAGRDDAGRDDAGRGDGGRGDASPPDASGAADGSASALAILPTDPVLEVETGKPLPKVQFSAASGGASVDAVFSVDRADLGSFDASGLFTASGQGAGTGVVTARWGSQTATAALTVRLTVRENGAADAGGSSPDAGAGGWGGVGGEGMGGPASAGDEAVLSGDPVADSSLELLYPYDGTVWPKDVLAPLLQWRSGSRDFSAVRIELSGSKFHYTGTFARTATPFVHHPIPPSAWKQLLAACAGETVRVKIALASQGAAYGPLEASWKIAKGSLKGTIYYNSYGTRLAQNSNEVDMGTGQKFGGATLAITGGALEPTLVAGANECRVCHVVSSTGSRLVTMHADYVTASAYDLKPPVQETTLPGSDARFVFGAISPDGSLLFGNGAPIIWEKVSALYSLPSGDVVATTGLPNNFEAGTPVFSQDGRKIAFNWYGGSVAGQGGADRRSLGVMDFSPPGAFSGFSKVFTPSGSTAVALYPSFLPDGSGLVFQVELQSNGRNKFGETRSNCEGSSGDCANTGARAELWWVDLATKQAVPLDGLNGKGHLPTGPDGHDQDATLNYEPTVGPVASGGYAWVVFTSRRLYGNVATLNPYWSDPRWHDLSKSPTPKKLWIAAVDLNATPGKDPSHPAFYVPAQELLAGNSRGYWVHEACRETGAACESGDQCCSGFCRAPSEGAPAACVEKPQGCAHEFESCQSPSDCCDGENLSCYGQRCTVATGPN